MAVELVALQSAIKLVADAVNDVVKSSGESATAKLVQFENLLPDVLSLIPQIGEIPAEVGVLHPESYQTLLTNLATDLALPAGKAEGVVMASLKLLSDIAGVVGPDVEALISAIKA